MTDETQPGEALGWTHNQLRQDLTHEEVMQALANLDDLPSLVGVIPEEIVGLLQDLIIRRDLASRSIATFLQGLLQDAVA